LPRYDFVELSIYNLNGQLITNLVKAKMLAGYHSVKWDSKDFTGNKVAGGHYLYNIKAGNFVAVQQLVAERMNYYRKM
jgi:flagellar hook assembly protein FlgD